MARSTGMDLVTIRVPGLRSHHSRQAASLRSQLIRLRPGLRANPSNSASSVDVTRSTPIWSPADSTFIKHIPKSARTSCASRLAALLRKTVSNPDSTSNLLELFNWGHTVLHAPKRGAKRHNLTSAIKVRISTFSLIAISPTQFTKLGGRQARFQLSVTRCRRNLRMATLGQLYVF